MVLAAVWGMPLVLMHAAGAEFDSTAETQGGSAIPPAGWATPDLGGLGIGSAPLHAAFGAAHEEDGDPAASQEGRPEFGAADSLRLNLIGGAVSNFSNTTGGTARLEFEYFMADRIAIVPVAELGWLAQENADDALLAGGAVLLRWHFLHRADWTIFADAGVGLLYAGASVPPGTNRIKFSPQIGAGFTLALEGDPGASRLMGGIRWYHLSNARTASSNDGFDGVMAYLGVSFPF